MPSQGPSAGWPSWVLPVQAPTLAAGPAGSHPRTGRSQQVTGWDSRPGCPLPQRFVACLLGFFVLLKVHKPKALRAARAVHHDLDAQSLSCKREGEIVLKPGTHPGHRSKQSKATRRHQRSDTSQVAGGAAGSLLPHGAASTTSPTQDAAHIATGFLGSAASSHLP